MQPDRRGQWLERGTGSGVLIAENVVEDVAAGRLVWTGQIGRAHV